MSKVHGLFLCGALLAAASACSDPDTFDPWVLEQLTPDQGFSVRIPEFDVAAGVEAQNCYFFRVPDISGGEDIWVDKTITAINPGSHHTNVFRVKTIVGLDPDLGEPIDLGDGIEGTVVYGPTAGAGECWRSSNWADWPLVANSQKSAVTNPLTEWQLPPHVASRFSPGEMLMLQTHYVNATTQETPFAARVGVNFYKTTDTEPMELGTIFASQQAIRICRSNPTPSYSGTCAFPEGADVTITAANGHFHSRGTKFQVFDWDGTTEEEPPMADRFYLSDTWDDPPMTTGLSVQPPDSGGIWWTCDYQWEEPPNGCDAVDARDPMQANDCCYTFGPIVEFSEHCNVFAYYYPKITTGSITCF